LFYKVEKLTDDRYKVCVSSKYKFLVWN
jgi:hypothetical protein